MLAGYIRGAAVRV
ncbi:hypothetical protein LINGRAHAP2_LOCUS33261 [Linum grandiflorum]